MILLKDFSSFNNVMLGEMDNKYFYKSIISSINCRFCHTFKFTFYLKIKFIVMLHSRHSMINLLMGNLSKKIPIKKNYAYD